MTKKTDVRKHPRKTTTGRTTVKRHKRELPDREPVFDIRTLKPNSVQVHRSEYRRQFKLKSDRSQTADLDRSAKKSLITGESIQFPTRKIFETSNEIDDFIQQKISQNDWMGIDYHFETPQVKDIGKTVDGYFGSGVQSNRLARSSIRGTLISIDTDTGKAMVELDDDVFKTSRSRNKTIEVDLDNLTTQLIPKKLITDETEQLKQRAERMNETYNNQVEYNEQIAQEGGWTKIKHGGKQVRVTKRSEQAHIDADKRDKQLHTKVLQDYDFIQRTGRDLEDIETSLFLYKKWYPKSYANLNSMRTKYKGESILEALKDGRKLNEHDKQLLDMVKFNVIHKIDTTLERQAKITKARKGAIKRQTSGKAPRSSIDKVIELSNSGKPVDFTVRDVKEAKSVEKQLDKLLTSARNRANTCESILGHECQNPFEFENDFREKLALQLGEYNQWTTALKNSRTKVRAYIKTNSKRKGRKKVKRNKKGKVIRSGN